MSLRDHIIAITIQLFSRNGIRRVSMDEVARKAGVSKRTLYDFFSDKETLLIDVLKKIHEPFSKHMASLESHSETALEMIMLFNERMMEKPVILCDDFMEDIKCYPKALQIMIEGKHSFIKKLIELLKRGEKESVFMSDIDYDLISLMAQQLMSHPMPSEVFSKYTFEEVHNTIFFIFIRGISTDSGRDILDKFITKKRYKHDFNE